MHFSNKPINQLLLQVLHNLHKLGQILKQQLGLFHRNEMAALVVVRAVHQIRIFLNQLPIHRVHQIVAESSATRGHHRGHTIELVRQLLCRKGLAVQSHRRGYRVRQIIEHDVVDDGVFVSRVER